MTLDLEPGTVVTYWRVSYPFLEIHETRATWHSFTRWLDHPWSARGQAGVDFVNEWALEERHGDGWVPLGRSGPDWMMPDSGKDRFATKAEAVAAALASCERAIVASREELARNMRRRDALLAEAVEAS